MRDEIECEVVRGKEVRFTQESERARESQLACARGGAGFCAKNKSAEDSVSNIVCCFKKQKQLVNKAWRRREAPGRSKHWRKEQGQRGKGGCKENRQGMPSIRSSRLMHATLVAQINRSTERFEKNTPLGLTLRGYFDKTNKYQMEIQI